MEGIRSLSALKQPSVFLLATAGLGPTQVKHDRYGLQWLGNLDLMPVAVESSQMVAVLSMALMAAKDNMKILGSCFAQDLSKLILVLSCWTG